MPRPRLIAPIALAVVCAALPPPALHAALAAAAGTLFEAAPFVLVGELVPLHRARELVALAGCGCGTRFPGALALPALALCWLAFGPFVTLSRATAGAILTVQRSVRPGGCSEVAGERDRADVFAELATLALYAGAASLVSGVLQAGLRAVESSAWGTGLAFAAGLALGSIMPCATAGIAVAAGLKGGLGAAAAGVLVTSGLFRLPLRHSADRGRRTQTAPFTATLIALALALLAFRGPSGLLNPRLLPLEPLGALAALVGARRRRTALGPVAAALPALMLGALVIGSPIPPERVDVTSLENAAPGERLAFTGTASVSNGATTLERFAITCCRIDASPVSVRLDRVLAVPAGSWVSATGTLVRTTAGALVMSPSATALVAAPADPFIYR